MAEKNDIDIKDEDLKEEDFTPEELEAEDVDWKAKALELKGIAKRRATQLVKAKEKLAIVPEKPLNPAGNPPPQKGESDEPDYGRLAFLNSSSVTHPDDQKAVLDEAKRLKLPLTDVLQMEHIKTRLQANKEDREAKAGMPRGRDRSGGSTPQDVDYHLAKGTTPDEQELAEKVVEARMKREEQKSKFSDILYNENI